MDWVLDAYVGSLFWIRDQLAPEHRFGRPPRHIVTLEWVRTGVAVGVSLLIAWLYTGFGEVGRLLSAPLFNLLLAVPALLVAAAVLLAAARPGQRKAVARALGRPVTTAGAVAAAAAGLFFAMNLATASHGFSLSSFFISCCIGLPVLLVLIVYVLPALTWASFLAVRHWFRAVDGHPMLPAVTAIGFAVAQLITLAVMGVDEDLPPTVGWLLGVGGPICLTGAAAAELHVLTGAGYSLRDLPRRA